MVLICSVATVILRGSGIFHCLIYASIGPKCGICLLFTQSFMNTTRMNVLTLFFCMALMLILGLWNLFWLCQYSNLTISQVGIGLIANTLEFLLHFLSTSPRQRLCVGAGQWENLNLYNRQCSENSHIMDVCCMPTWLVNSWCRCSSDTEDENFS